MSDTQTPGAGGTAGKAPARARKRPVRKAAAKPAADVAAPAPAEPTPPAPPVETGEIPAAAKPPARRGGRKPAEGQPPAPAPGQHLISVPTSVRWRDLDAFNHVNNSIYLSYLEEARLQWLLEVPGLGIDDHVAPVVAATQLNYRRPVTWPAQLLVELFVERLGNTSLSIGHRIVDARERDVLYCDGHVVMVWIDRDSGQPAPLPREVRRRLGG